MHGYQIHHKWSYPVQIMVVYIIHNCSIFFHRILCVLQLQLLTERFVPRMTQRANVYLTYIVIVSLALTDLIQIKYQFFIFK